MPVRLGPVGADDAAFQMRREPLRCPSIFFARAVLPGGRFAEALLIPASFLRRG